MFKKTLNVTSIKSMKPQDKDLSDTY